MASLQSQPLSQQGIWGNSELSARGRKGLSFIVYHLQIQRPQEKKVCRRGQSTVLFNQGRRAPWSRGYEGCADWRGQGSQWSPDSPLTKSGELRAPCCQPGQALRVESVGGLHVRTGATKQRLGVASGEEAPASPWRWTFLQVGAVTGGSGLDESSHLTCSLHPSRLQVPTNFKTWRAGPASTHLCVCTSVVPAAAVALNRTGTLRC